MSVYDMQSNVPVEPKRKTAPDAPVTSKPLPQQPSQLPQKASPFPLQMLSPQPSTPAYSGGTGIPVQMQRQFEAQSGLSFRDVRVHYNSGAPAKFGALAYTRGSQVYLGPGQEQHLPHELGHVVQQIQGRVQPTRWQNGVPINDDPALEREADHPPQKRQPAHPRVAAPLQCFTLNPKTLALTGQREGTNPRDQNPKELVFNKSALTYKIEGVDSLVAKSVTLHHILPETLLVAFWNKISHFYVPDIAAAFIKELLHGVLSANFEQRRAPQPYLQGSAQPEIYALPTKGATSIDKLHACIDRLGEAETDAEVNQFLVTLYLWMPGNLLAGPSPSQRSGDPGHSAPAAPPASPAFAAYMAAVGPQYEAAAQAFKQQLERIKAEHTAGMAARAAAIADEEVRVKTADAAYKSSLPPRWEKDKGLRDAVKRYCAQLKEPLQAMNQQKDAAQAAYKQLRRDLLAQNAFDHEAAATRNPAIAAALFDLQQKLFAFVNAETAPDTDFCSEIIHQIIDLLARGPLICGPEAVWTQEPTTKKYTIA